VWIKQSKLRPAHAFEALPILAFRVVLSGVQPTGGEDWSSDTLLKMLNDLFYLNAGPVKVVQVRNLSEAQQELPLAVKILTKPRGKKEWENYANSLIHSGLAVPTNIDSKMYLRRSLYSEEAFGIEGQGNCEEVSGISIADANWEEVPCPFLQPREVFFTNQTIPVRVLSLQGMHEVYFQRRHTNDHHGTLQIYEDFHCLIQVATNVTLHYFLSQYNSQCIELFFARDTL